MGFEFTNKTFQYKFKGSTTKLFSLIIASLTYIYIYIYIYIAPRKQINSTHNILSNLINSLNFKTRNKLTLIRCTSY